ncbi:MAG: DUF805 domain-containing protein [Nocardioidaceae bacterium]|nr:DUF805 domain-containing protein [Nocardioidaceae bacterium]
MSYGSPPPPPGGQPPPYGQQNPYGQYGQGYGQQQPYGAPMAPAAGDPGTLDLPYYGIDFITAIKRAFQKYARFDGRASRGEYWWFALGYGALILVCYIPMIIGIVAESPGLVVPFAILFIVAVIAAIVPGIAVAVRRLHDIGLSGWLYLISLVPFGGIVMLVLMCLPSKPEGAKYDRFTGGQPGYNQQGYPNPYGQ